MNLNYFNIKKNNIVDISNFSLYIYNLHSRHYKATLQKLTLVTPKREEIPIYLIIIKAYFAFK